MEITIKDVEELADNIIKMEYPIYDNAGEGIKRIIIKKREMIRLHLIYWLNQKEIEVLPICCPKC